ncbi:MAG: hypothetical protein LAO78_01765 [Acidobacteriia bacterium]|nr:hypothetical protein [Terriglobia bacterium]
MTSARRTGKSRRRKPAPFGKLPLSVTNRDGKTTIRQLADRRIIRLGEVRGKTVAYVELYTSKQDSHSLNIRFTDKTRLALAISPGFTIKAQYYKVEGLGDPQVLKRWPEIKSE